MRSLRYLPQPCTVEELLRRIGEVTVSDDCFELWVPKCLTLEGKAVDVRSAFALVLSRVRELSEDFMPAGIVWLPGGYLYRFERWTDDQTTEYKA